MNFYHFFFGTKIHNDGKKREWNKECQQNTRVVSFEMLIPHIDEHIQSTRSTSCQSHMFNVYVAFFWAIFTLVFGIYHLNWRYVQFFYFIFVWWHFMLTEKVVQCISHKLIGIYFSFLALCFSISASITLHFIINACIYGINEKWFAVRTSFSFDSELFVVFFKFSSLHFSANCFSECVPFCPKTPTSALRQFIFLYRRSLSLFIMHLLTPLFNFVIMYIKFHKIAKRNIEYCWIGNELTTERGKKNVLK